MLENSRDAYVKSTSAQSDISLSIQLLDYQSILNCGKFQVSSAAGGSNKFSRYSNDGELLAVIEVEDRGCGIENVESILESFTSSKRVMENQTATDFFAGKFGLGLPLW